MQAKQKIAVGAAVSALLMGVSLSAFGQGDGGKHSKVEVESKTVGGNVEMTFKVVPTAGHKVTLDAPWKLDVKNADGLQLEKTTYAKAEMDEKLPGFKLASTKVTKPAGDVEYKLISFVCTENKTSCYREVHEGKASWKK